MCSVTGNKDTLTLLSRSRNWKSNKLCLPRWFWQRICLPMQEDAGDASLISGSGRSPGGGHGNPQQYSSMENPMDRRAWWATVHGVANSWTWTEHACVYKTIFHHHSYFSCSSTCLLINWKISPRSSDNTLMALPHLSSFSTPLAAVSTSYWSLFSPGTGGACRCLQRFSSSTSQGKGLKQAPTPLSTLPLL